MALPLHLSPLRNQGPQQLFTYLKKETLDQMMFYWGGFGFFCSLAETISCICSTIICYYRHERDITATEMICSIHWFHCIIVINGDVNTLASYN